MVLKGNSSLMYTMCTDITRSRRCGISALPIPGKRDLHRVRRPLNHFALDRHHEAWRAPTEGEGEGEGHSGPRLSEFKDSPAVRPSGAVGHSFSVGIRVHCVMMGRGIPSSQSIYHSKAGRGWAQAMKRPWWPLPNPR